MLRLSDAVSSTAKNIKIDNHKSTEIDNVSDLLYPGAKGDNRRWRVTESKK